MEDLDHILRAKIRKNMLGVPATPAGKCTQEDVLLAEKLRVYQDKTGIYIWPPLEEENSITVRETVEEYLNRVHTELESVRGIYEPSL